MHLIRNLCNRGMRLMQDGAAYQSAHTTMALLQANRVNVLAWTSRSPDLNPIERIWDVIGREVRRRSPRNVRQLQQFVVEEWNRIARRTCLGYVASMHSHNQNTWRSFQVLFGKPHVSVEFWLTLLPWRISLKSCINATEWNGSCLVSINISLTECCLKPVQFCNCWKWGLLCLNTWGAKDQWFILINLLKFARYIFLTFLKFSYQYLEQFWKYSKKSIGDIISVVKCMSDMSYETGSW